MGDQSFDDLLQAFQSALVAAQDSLRIRSEEAIRRRFEADGRGRASFFTFAIPQPGTGGDKYALVPLPAASFRAPHRPWLSMLSLEFEFYLKEKRLPDASRRYALVIVARNQRRWWHEKRRRMQIVFHGADRPSGEVRMDGELLAEIPGDGWAGKGRATPEAKRSIFSKLIHRLRNRWRPQHFVMTAEQSQRVREIVAQSDAKTLPRGETAIWKKAIFAKDFLVRRKNEQAQPV